MNLALPRRCRIFAIAAICCSAFGRYWPFATFRWVAELGRYQSRADMAQLAAGSIRSGMTRSGHQAILRSLHFGALPTCYWPSERAHSRLAKSLPRSCVISTIQSTERVLNY
jgi:hypothetical protein